MSFNMTPQVGNRLIKPFQQSQLSLISKQTMNQQAQLNIIDYSTQCKSSQPIVSEDNCRTTNSRKSISNIAQSLASKRLNKSSLIQEINNMPETFSNYFDARFNSEYKTSQDNNFSSLQSRQSLIHQRQNIKSSQSHVRTKNLDISFSKDQTQINFYVPSQIDHQNKLQTNPSKPILQNSHNAKQIIENAKQKEHFDNLIDHLRKVKNYNGVGLITQKTEVTSFKGSMNSTLNKNSSMIISDNKKLNVTSNFLESNNSFAVNRKEIIRPSTQARQQISSSQLSQRPQTQFNKDRNQYVLFSQIPNTTNVSQFDISKRQDSRQKTDDLKTNNSFIRKNFYMVRQQPSSRQKPQPDPSNNYNVYSSAITESPIKGAPPVINNTILMRKQMYQNNNGESGIGSQRNNLSERLSTAYQKLNKYEPNKSIAESSVAGKRKNLVVKRQNLVHQEDTNKESPLVQYELLVTELQRLEQKEENMEKCIIPNFPIIDTSQSHNQPFLDLIREIKKEFTNETCTNVEDQIFSGAYTQDKAKGLGRKIDQKNYIYKGNFSEGVKKGPGIQVFLCQAKNYDVFRGEWSEDKPNGRGIYFYFKTGMFIEGNFKDGNPETNGNFKIRYTNGDVYEGTIHNRYKSGKGKIHYINGDLYEGEWQNDKREGQGKFYIKSEDISIEGLFVNDEIKTGKLIDKFGNIHTTLEDELCPGKFVKGKLNGKVKIEYANSNIFLGIFVDGKRQGKGKMTYNDLKMIQDEESTDQAQQLQDLEKQKLFSTKTKRDTNSKANSKAILTEQGEYDGIWKRDIREGFGIMKWGDGSKFEGEWRNDQRRKGKMYMGDGNVYEGEFVNDKYHGKGQITMRTFGRNSDGQQNMKIFYGIFDQGKVPSKGKIVYTENGNIYYGSHIDFEKQGYGYLFSADGTKYQGEFLDDKKEGVGIILYPNGDYYHGQFVCDKKEGVGRQYYKSEGNRVFEGNWAKDERSGEGYLIDPQQQVIIKGYWRQGKIDGKTVVLNMNDLGQIQLLRDHGIDVPIDIRDAFKIPEAMKNL